MFFSKSPNRSAKSESLATLIDSSVVINGELRFDKSARIDGTVRGNVTGSNAKKGVLIIGPEARIEGDVSCHNVVVLGNVKGAVTASYIEIRKGAQITGDVHYDVIEAHQGASINGRLLRNPGSDGVPLPSATPQAA